MTALGIHTTISAFLLVLCAIALMLLTRLHGVGAAVVAAVLLTVVGTIAFCRRSSSLSDQQSIGAAARSTKSPQ
jgi:uncharacterized membrane protein YvlD (DUF360 family)